MNREKNLNILKLPKSNLLRLKADIPGLKDNEIRELWSTRE